MTKKKDMTEEEREALRQKKLANLKMFSSEYQPAVRKPKKGKRISTIIKEMLSQKARFVIEDIDKVKDVARLFDKDVNDVTMEDIMLYQSLQKAMKGDYRFYKDMMDRGYGQATQQVEISTSDDDVDLSQLTPEQIKELANIAIEQEKK